MNVIDIIKIQLVVGGVDGLYNLNRDCGCLLNDVFAPCDEDNHPGPYPDCEEGNEIPCNCGEHDYHVGPVK